MKLTKLELYGLLHLQAEFQRAKAELDAALLELGLNPNVNWRLDGDVLVEVQSPVPLHVQLEEPT